MDFFERQDRARTRTRWLVMWFAVAVAAIVIAVYLAVLAIFGGSRTFDGPGLEAAGGFDFWRPDLFATAALSVLALVGSASLYKVAALRQGGEEVARWLGGRPIDSNTDDLALRRLLNVVEEIAIASGTPVPTVFVLEKESGINAFAAGFSTADAVIGVTRGCVDHLSRDEHSAIGFNPAAGRTFT